MREMPVGQLSMKEEQATGAGGRRLPWVPSVKKGARGGGAGPAPSPGGRGRGRETLRGGSGGSERQLSGHRGPSCTCCPTEDEAAARAVTWSRRSQAGGTQSRAAWHLSPCPSSLPLCWVRCPRVGSKRGLGLVDPGGQEVGGLWGEGERAA